MKLSLVSYSPYMLNLGSLGHSHDLKEAHIVIHLGPESGEVKDPFVTFSRASLTDWTPFEAPKT